CATGWCGCTKPRYLRSPTNPATENPIALRRKDIRWTEWGHQWRLSRGTFRSAPGCAAFASRWRGGESRVGDRQADPSHRRKTYEKSRPEAPGSHRQDVVRLSDRRMRVPSRADDLRDYTVTHILCS